MVNYKPNGDKKNAGVIIVTVIFAIIGLICIIIGYNVRILRWLKTFGIVSLALLSPVILFVIYKIIKDKIERM